MIFYLALGMPHRGCAKHAVRDACFHHKTVDCILLLDESNGITKIKGVSWKWHDVPSVSFIRFMGGEEGCTQPFQESVTFCGSITLQDLMQIRFCDPGNSADPFSGCE